MLASSRGLLRFSAKYDATARLRRLLGGFGGTARDRYRSPRKGVIRLSSVRADVDLALRSPAGRPETSGDAEIDGVGRDSRVQPRGLLRLLMRSDATAPRRAREALRVLAAIDSIRDDALLVASELVSNAVVHSGSDPSEEIELVAELERSALRLVVTDPGHSDQMPTVRGSEYGGPGGRGLRVVEALARRWGRERRGGTVVWVELPLEASNVAGHQA